MAPQSHYAAAARHEAQTILSRPPYQSSPPPRPLAGVLHAIGHGIDVVFGSLARWLYHHLLLKGAHGFHLLFGGWWLVALGVLACVLGALLALVLVRRRTRVGSAGEPESQQSSSKADPSELEQRADGAERAGDFETAVRLRFVAGLLRLQRRGLVDNSAARTGRQVAPTLHSLTFNQLVDSHERIAYAGQPASASDSVAARDGWPRVLAEAHSDGADEAAVPEGPRAPVMVDAGRLR